MAKKNRTELAAATLTDIVAELEIPQHQSYLINQLIASFVTEKDVIDSETPSGGTVTIDYADKDTATVVTTTNLSVSFTNVENGAVKYLFVSKSSTNALTFPGANNTTEYQEYVDNKYSSVLYCVLNKNGVIYVKAVNQTIIKAVSGDIALEDPYSFPNAKAVYDYVLGVLSDYYTQTQVDNIINSVTGGITTKKVNIPIWNMNGTGTGTFSLTVPHGLSGVDTLIGYDAFIIPDASAPTQSLRNIKHLDASWIPSGSIQADDTNVYLTVKPGGVFDNSSYNSISEDPRGYILIWYIAGGA